VGFFNETHFKSSYKNWNGLTQYLGG
jgi:hypothetical protein